MIKKTFSIILFFRLSEIDVFIYMKKDYIIMGLFSRFRKKKKDSEDLGGKTTDIYDEQRKNPEKEPVSN